MIKGGLIHRGGLIHDRYTDRTRDRRHVMHKRTERDTDTERERESIDVQIRRQRHHGWKT
jgi:hypothetical protein